MSFGFLAGVLDSNQIGASLVATYAYAANQSVNTLLPVSGVDVLTTLSIFQIPQVDFSPTTVMTLPTAYVSLAHGGVYLTASGGSIPVTLLIFGR